MELVDLLNENYGTRPYKERVALFFKIYPEKVAALAEFFETDDQFSREQLAAGLEEKRAELLAHQERNEFKVFKESNHSQRNAQLVPYMPEDLRKEYARLGPLFSRISQLHSRLPFALDNTSRFEMAREIVEKTAERRAILNQVDEFEALGTVTKKIMIDKEKIDPSKLKNFEVEYKLKLLKSQRTKLKNKPARVDEYNMIVQHIHDLEKTRYV